MLLREKKLKEIFLEIALSVIINIDSDFLVFRLWIKYFFKENPSPLFSFESLSGRHLSLLELT